MRQPWEFFEMKAMVWIIFVILRLNYQPATVIVLETIDIRRNTDDVNVWL